MSACRAQAISQVGCRLMVASSANTNRPLAPVACGDMARALATKAAMSSDVDATEGAFAAEDLSAGGVSLPDCGLAGSRDIRASQIYRELCGEARCLGQSGPRKTCKRRRRPSVLDRRVERNRPRHGFRRDRRRGVVVEEFVEHPFDRGLRLFRPGIAHIVMLEAGLDDRDTGFLADVAGGYHAR